MIRTLLIVSVLVVVASAASAQTVLPPVMAHPPNPAGTGYAETAIVLSGNDVVVAYNDVAPFIMRYSVSLDGGATFPSPYNAAHYVGQDCVLGPLPKGVDPMGARAANGDIVIGGQMALAVLPAKAAFSISRKGLGLSLFGTPTPLTCVDSTAQPDKDLMAIGPSRDGTREKVYVSYTLSADNAPCPAYGVRVVQSDLATPSLSTDLPLSPDATCSGARAGLGAVPVVLPANYPSPQLRGRVAVAFMPLPTQANLPPEMWWSDTEGGALPGSPAWQQTTFPVLVQTPGASPEPVLPYSDSDVSGLFKPRSFPALAFHRPDPSIVYLIFPATTPSAGAGNVDLIIMRSNDGGVSFLSQNALHVTDSMLGLPAGIDQILPWIGVDELGGVNFIFTTVRENPLDPSTILLRNYYARFATFNATSPSAPFVHATSAEFEPIADAGHPGEEYVRDYHMLDVQGCKVVIAQMAVTPGSGGADIYVTRVFVCAADADQDGALTANDPPAFAALYVACDPRADLTRNGSVDAADVQAFMEAFVCQCNP